MVFVQFGRTNTGEFLKDMKLQFLSCRHFNNLIKISKYFKFFQKDILIIHEENTKKNHKRVVFLYVTEISLDLHKL
jgi:hypothetical protein